MRSPRTLAALAVLGAGILFLARRERDLLQLDTRRRTYECVHAYPGLHLREIARLAGLDPNHAKYHLQYLERHGLVSSRKEDGYWRFWPRQESTTTGMREKLSSEDKSILAVLRRPIPLHVTVLLLENPEMIHGQILERVPVSHSTLHYHLAKMEAVGLVTSRKQGRERIYAVVNPDKVRVLLSQNRPPDKLVEGFLEAWGQLDFR